jgi:hypothetical protein
MPIVGPEIPAHLLNRHRTDEDGHDTDSNLPIGPEIPSELLEQEQDDDDEEEEDYLPALPPDMVATRSAGPYAGPSTSIVSRPPPAHSLYNSIHYSDDDDDDDVGPKPLPPGVTHAETDAVREFMEKEEKRRKELEVRGSI